MEPNAEYGANVLIYAYLSMTYLVREGRILYKKSRGKRRVKGIRSTILPCVDYSPTSSQPGASYIFLYNSYFSFYPIFGIEFRVDLALLLLLSPPSSFYI